MADKSAAQKMQVKPGWKIHLVNAPRNAVTLLGELPEGATIASASTEDSGALARADTILLFANNRAELEAELPGLLSAVGPGRSVWVAYHKGTSKVKTDIHRDTINDYAKSLGFQGNFMVSIDEDWAALRLKPI